MVLYPSDLAYCTPDADGVVRLNRGVRKQVKIPYPSFVGDVRMFRGTADQIGKGDLLGWELIQEIPVDTVIRVAMSDAEVGQVSGTNTYTPSGTVNLLHDHGGAAGVGGGGDTFLGGAGNTGDSDAGTTEPADDTSTVENDTVSPVSVASATHGHNTTDHNHSTPDHDHSMPTHNDHAIDEDLADDTPLTLDPIEITPKAISFYLIAYSGVIAV